MHATQLMVLMIIQIWNIINLRKSYSETGNHFIPILYIMPVSSIAFEPDDHAF